MNERDEFRLPLELEQVLACPMTLELPQPEVLARRAIVLSRKARASRTERYAHLVGATMLIMAFVRMLSSWWMNVRFEYTISNTFAAQLCQAMWNVFGYASWIVIFGGILAGGVVFTVGKGRKTLSE